MTDINCSYAHHHAHRRRCVRGPRGLRGPRGYRGQRGLRGLTGLPGGEAFPCTGNLLQNPSFDDFVPGTPLTVPSGWHSPDSPLYLGPPSTLDDVHSGDGSIVYYFPDSLTSQGFIQQSVPAVQGRCYCLDFWAKGAICGGSSLETLKADVEFELGHSQLTPHCGITIHGESLDSLAWTSYRVVTPPAPPDTVRALVRFTVRGTIKAVRIDDVTLTASGRGRAAT